MNRVLQFLSDRAMEYFSDRVALRIHRIMEEAGTAGLRVGYSPKRSLRSRAAAGTVHASGTNFQL